MTPSRSPVLKTRELDALIAEKVFGFRREGQPKDYDGNFGGEPVLLPPSAVSWEALESILPKKGRMALTYFVPEYSTDIAKSFLVVEQMRERGFIYEVSEVPGVPRTRQHYASFTELGRWYGHDDIHTDLEPDGQAVADTPALAICEAALKALGFSPPEGVQR